MPHHPLKYEWSTASCLSKCRHLIFLTIKLPKWKAAVLATQATSGSQFSLLLSRPKAWHLKRENALNGKVDRKMNIALFSQFFRDCTRTRLPLASLRRHTRLYEVKFLGENAQDAGGPYRESWQDYASELMSTCLPLFLPVPNEKDPKSANRDQWLPNPNPTDSSVDDSSSSKLHTDAMEFVGKLLGVAMRNELCLPLNFASIVWKALSNDTPTLDDLYCIDASTLSITTLIRTFGQSGQSGHRSSRAELSELFMDLELY
jgi:hypothetical protein